MRQTQVEPKEQPLSKKVGMTITMNSINGGFGFRIVGGRDINAEMTPQVDLVAPGEFIACLLSYHIKYSHWSLSLLIVQTCMHERLESNIYSGN